MGHITECHAFILRKEYISLIVLQNKIIRVKEENNALYLSTHTKIHTHRHTYIYIYIYILLYSHNHDQLYKHIIHIHLPMHAEHNDTMKTSDTVFLEKYASHSI